MDLEKVIRTSPVTKMIHSFGEITWSLLLSSVLSFQARSHIQFPYCMVHTIVFETTSKWPILTIFCWEKWISGLKLIQRSICEVWRPPGTHLFQEYPRIYKNYPGTLLWLTAIFFNLRSFNQKRLCKLVNCQFINWLDWTYSSWRIF